MKYLKIFEDFESVKYPDSITVELTDVWKNTHELYRMPDKVDLPNNNELYHYIGNTRLGVDHGTIYYATRKDNLIFIIGFDASDSFDMNELELVYPMSKTQIDNIPLRKFPESTCTLGPNADYKGELEVGMSDHRGYFEITSMK